MSEKESVKSIVNTKDNAWEETRYPTSSGPGEVGGNPLEEVLETFFSFGSNQNV